jgi:hypothetical protein
MSSRCRRYIYDCEALVASGGILRLPGLGSSSEMSCWNYLCQSPFRGFDSAMETHLIDPSITMVPGPIKSLKSPVVEN